MKPIKSMKIKHVDNNWNSKREMREKEVDLKSRFMKLYPLVLEIMVNQITSLFKTALDKILAVLKGSQILP